MNLRFLGRGSAFNAKEGNNSAYFVDGDQLFLIDCGESIFERLRKTSLLEDADVINLIITHTHSDHVGSLETLASYIYYDLKKSLKIITKSDGKHTPSVEKVFETFGANPVSYGYVDETEYDDKFSAFQSVRYLETNHSSRLSCYGVLFTTPRGLVYYSGDTKDAKNIETLIASGQDIDKIYVDTTTAHFPGSVHLYLGDLRDRIPENLRSKVFCMHVNSDACIDEAKQAGFNVVEVGV